MAIPNCHVIRINATTGFMKLLNYDHIKYFRYHKGKINMKSANYTEK